MTGSDEPDRTESACIHGVGCLMCRAEGQDAVARMRRMAQQIRYCHRDASALSGLIDGLLETVDATSKEADNLDGTARISIKSLRAMQELAGRVKDKATTLGQLVRFIDYLTGDREGWGRLDE